MTSDDVVFFADDLGWPLLNLGRFRGGADFELGEVALASMPFQQVTEFDLT